MVSRLKLNNQENFNKKIGKTMKANYKGSYFSGREVNSDKFLDLDKDENVVSRFKNFRKTKYKAFGNRLTDFLVITNKKLIYVYLVEAGLIKMKDAYYKVEYIPHNIITKIQAIESSAGVYELKVGFSKGEEKEEVCLTWELRDQTHNAIALIESMR